MSMRALESWTAEVNQLRLHYRTGGAERAPCVAVLHGIMGHAWEWDELLDQLAPHYRLVVPDARGHGLSDRATDYSAEAMASDLTGVLEQAGAVPVRLVGHSMGGIVALLVTLSRPELVEQLVLIDVGPGSLTSNWARQELAPMLASFGEALYTSPCEALAEWLAANPLAQERLLRHSVTHNLVRTVEGRLAWRFDAAHIGRFVTGGPSDEDLWHVLGDVTAPTLVIRGEHSELLSPETAKRMAAALPGTRLVEIPSAGHDIGVEQPLAAADAVLDFLGTMP
jgi:pimeloyl-ACP methyl ester carboxylesterase